MGWNNFQWKVRVSYVATTNAAAVDLAFVVWLAADDYDVITVGHIKTEEQYSEQHLKLLDSRHQH
jgi:hypothetical protein